jgi:hypothetical protein
MDGWNQADSQADDRTWHDRQDHPRAQSSEATAKRIQIAARDQDLNENHSQLLAFCTFT